MVVPALNEERNIGQVLRRVPPGMREVVLVDGASVDRTVEVARETLPSVVVVRQTRTGKGNALACGFAACTGDIIVMIDADGSTDPAEIPLFVAALRAGADYAKGSRFRPGGGSDDITRFRRLGNRGLNGAVNTLFHTSFTDLCYGYNAFWRERVLPCLDLPDPALPVPADGRKRWGDGFEIETLINIRVATHGLRIAEVASMESRRISGASNLRAVSDGTRVLRTIVREYRRRHRGGPVRRPTGAASPAPALAGPAPGSSAAVAGDPIQLPADQQPSRPTDQQPSRPAGKQHDPHGGGTRQPQGRGPDGAPPVSVVIPCHTERRWHQLVAAVRSVRVQQPPPAEIIITVDHNDALLRRARQAFTGLTVLANTFGPGASGNRNTGVLHADAPFVALLDGDARAAAGWLAALIGPLADPAVVGTGGRVRPLWESGQPAWFPDEFLWAVGGSYTGLPTTVARVRNVWSGNMAVRRADFTAVSGFRLGFGHVGDRYRPEDTDLCLRMAATGGRWVYVPGALVDHPVPSSRTTVSFFLSRCFQEGRGKVELARLNSGPASLRTEGVYLRHTLPRAFGRDLYQAVRGRGAAHAARAGMVVIGAAAAATGGAVESITQRRRPATTLDGTEDPWRCGAGR